MALKTTIGPNGVVTETVAGNVDQLVVDVASQRASVRTVVSASSAAVVDLSLADTTLLVAPGASSVTCSLPALNNDEVGRVVTLVHDSNGETVQLSGSNNINGSATLDYGVAYGVVKLLGVKADDDGAFVWTILEQKGTA